jgi:hypothetical protein
MPGPDKLRELDISAMRRFAVELPDDLGPLFGRDVIRVLDALGAANKRANAASLNAGRYLRERDRLAEAARAMIAARYSDRAGAEQFAAENLEAALARFKMTADGLDSDPSDGAGASGLNPGLSVSRLFVPGEQSDE